ncbi:hypothetical protein BLA29_010887 [Euroglyphus maynei]|uniref:Uncharacterized protein n=1 Tax=Euroglyphus maynei TaxID=6958 RepID=A0A1Y3B9A1_EURMA|nr:hypothetical protein BLA29_010887 [Euroglyphus maynei]
MSASTQSVNSMAIIGNTSSSVSSSTSSPSSLVPAQNNLVSGMTATGTNTSFNSSKLNRNKPQTEKKDAASGTENKSSTLVSSSTSTMNLNLKSQMKTNLNSIRNNSTSNSKNKIPLVLSSSPLLTNNSNQIGKISNHQTMNGTQTPSPANKTLTMNGGLTNGVLAKSNTTNTIPSSNNGSQMANKAKQNDPNQVLTH